MEKTLQMDRQSAFALLITTHNRLDELKITLEKSAHWILKEGVEVIICDDASTDGTTEWLQTNYTDFKLIRNEKNRGLIYSRNLLLSKTRAEYAISLDDDAHFLSSKPLKSIKNHFLQYPACGLIAGRIYWGIEESHSNFSKLQTIEKTRGFVGCGHIWRMQAWRDIPDYPDWFYFGGEEDYASLHLFRAGWEIHRPSDLWVHHRVSMAHRKKDGRGHFRRRVYSLRSGWSLMFIFYPLSYLPRHFFYSLGVQLKKALKGDWKNLAVIFMAFWYLFSRIYLILKNRKPLSVEEFKIFRGLSPAEIYGNP